MRNFATSVSACPPAGHPLVAHSRTKVRRPDSRLSSSADSARPSRPTTAQDVVDHIADLGLGQLVLPGAIASSRSSILMIDRGPIRSRCAISTGRRSARCGLAAARPEFGASSTTWPPRAFARKAQPRSVPKPKRGWGPKGIANVRHTAATTPTRRDRIDSSRGPKLCRLSSFSSRVVLHNLAVASHRAQRHLTSSIGHDGPLTYPARAAPVRRKTCPKKAQGKPGAPI